MVSSNKIRLISSDGETFEVDKTVAVEAQTIKHMIDDGVSEGDISIPNVTSKILAKVLEYCKKQVESKSADGRVSNDELRDWNTEFMKVDKDTNFDLLKAAKYLDVKGLLDLTYQKVADMVKGKTPEEIRKLFNIENDFTPEEEAEIRRENQWAFE